MIERCESVEAEGWLTLRQALWPHCTADEHLSEMSALCASPNRFVQFIAYASARRAIGFVEASVRSDYVNGTESSPVGFLEGIYVVPEQRRQGVARSLIANAEQWVQSVGCHEFASDALLQNQQSHALHRSLGFSETERVVFFRKVLA